MIGQSRRKRFGMGLSASISMIFAVLLALMVNYISHNYSFRTDLSRAQYLRLSEGTRSLLDNLDIEIDIILLAGPGHNLYRSMLYLLREYEYSSDRVRVEVVDPNRDLARAKRIALEHGIDRPGCVILVSEGRRKTIPLEEMADYDHAHTDPGLPGKITAFRGEQVVSSAIRGLVAVRDPVVYFLGGHGEARIDSYDRHFGYSILARKLQRQNISAGKLMLGETTSVPEDCDVLVIAGLARPLARAEVDIIRSYLDDAGRLLLMVDAWVTTGLEEFLAEWGVQLSEDRVIGPTLTGRELVVAEYGEHAITRNLGNIRTIFNMPRSVEPLVPVDSDRSVDRPLVTPLATSTEKGWADMPPSQNPPVFDPETDRPGPISVAVAVERGALPDVAVSLKPTRMVIIGDSTFISNGAFLAGYSADFFFSALNWLLERDAPMDIEPGKPPGIQVIMTLAAIYMTSWIIAAGIPAAVILVGLMVWAARRK